MTEAMRFSAAGTELAALTLADHRPIVPVPEGASNCTCTTGAASLAYSA